MFISKAQQFLLQYESDDEREKLYAKHYDRHKRIAVAVDKLKHDMRSEMGTKDKPQVGSGAQGHVWRRDK